MQIENNTTHCFECNVPLVWIGRTKRQLQGREVTELDFRCDQCRREYRYRDGKLRELKIERDPVTEQLAMRQAEINSVRNRRCLSCGGPLDDWLTCDWCRERYSAENGELVPRIEEPVHDKRKIADFYALQSNQ